MSYARILVAVDLSAEAEQVLDAARNQAALQDSAEVHIVSVVNPLPLHLAALMALQR